MAIKILKVNATVHWLLQRVTAVLLIPLSYWPIMLFKLASTATYQTTFLWLTAPLNALLLGIWIVSVFYHAALGLQVVLEDYVSTQPLQAWSIRTTNVVFCLMAFTALAMLLKIILQGNS